MKISLAILVLVVALLATAEPSPATRAVACLRAGDPKSEPPVVALPFANSCSQAVLASVCVYHADSTFTNHAQSVPARDTASIVVDRRTFLAARRWTWTEGPARCRA